MTQYYILEIQKYTTGEYGHIVHFEYDEDPTAARLKAESKYHLVLSAAAISQLPSHSATLIATDGREVMHQCYLHNIPEPEPVDPGESGGEGGEEQTEPTEEPVAPEPEEPVGQPE